MWILHNAAHFFIVVDGSKSMQSFWEQYHTYLCHKDPLNFKVGDHKMKTRYMTTLRLMKDQLDEGEKEEMKKFTKEYIDFNKQADYANILTRIGSNLSTKVMAHLEAKDMEIYDLQISNKVREGTCKEADVKKTKNDLVKSYNTKRKPRFQDTVNGVADRESNVNTAIEKLKKVVVAQPTNKQAMSFFGLVI